MNIKSIILATILIGSFSTTSAQKLVSKARWQSLNIKIDGKNNEWEKPFNFYDNKSGMLYSLANDSNNLYLCFSIDNILKLKKILKAGWNIEISSKEKKNKFKSIIIFPLLFADIMLDAKNQNSSGIAASSYQFQLNQLITNGFINQNDKTPFLAIKGNKINVGTDSLNNFIYEIAIPFKNIFKNKISLNEVLRLEVNINGLEINAENKLYLTNNEKKTRMNEYNKFKQDMKTNINNPEHQKVLLYKTNFKLKFQLNNN